MRQNDKVHFLYRGQRSSHDAHWWQIFNRNSGCLIWVIDLYLYQSDLRISNVMLGNSDHARLTKYLLFHDQMHSWSLCGAPSNLKEWSIEAYTKAWLTMMTRDVEIEFDTVISRDLIWLDDVHCHPVTISRTWFEWMHQQWGHSSLAHTPLYRLSCLKWVGNFVQQPG